MAKTSKLANRAVSILLGATLLFGGTLTAYAQIADDRVTSDGFVFNDVYGASGDGYAFMGDLYGDDKKTLSYSKGNLISKTFGNVTPDDVGKDKFDFWNFNRIDSNRTTIVYETESKLGLFDLTSGNAVTGAIYDNGDNSYDTTRKLTYSGFLTYDTKGSTSSGIGTFSGAKLTIYDGTTVAYEEDLTHNNLQNAEVSTYSNTVFVTLDLTNDESVMYEYKYADGKYSKSLAQAQDWQPTSTFYKGTTKYTVTVDNGVLQLSTDEGTPVSLGINVTGNYFTSYVFGFLPRASAPIIFVRTMTEDYVLTAESYYNINGEEITAFKNKSVSAFGNYIISFPNHGLLNNNIEIYNESLTLQRNIDCIDAMIIGDYDSQRYLAYLVKDTTDNKFYFKILTNKLADMGVVESAIYADDITNYKWNMPMRDNTLIVLDEQGTTPTDGTVHKGTFFSKSESGTTTKTFADVGINATLINQVSVYGTYNPSHTSVAIVVTQDENKIYVVDDSLQNAKSLTVAAFGGGVIDNFPYLYPVPIKEGFCLSQGREYKYYDYDLNPIDIQDYNWTQETGAFNVLTTNGVTTLNKDLQPIAAESYNLGLSKAKNAFAGSGNALFRFDSNGNKLLTYVNDGNGKHGAVNKDGKVVIELEYDEYFDTGYYGQRYILLKKEGKWSFFDLSKVLPDVRFDPPPGTEQPDPSEDKYVQISVKSEDAASNGIEAWIKNPTLDGTYQLVAKVSTAAAPKEALKNKVAEDNRALIETYDLTLYVNGSKTEENFGELIVKFPIPSSYANYPVYIYHCHKDDPANITKHQVQVETSTSKAQLDGIKDLCSFAVAFQANGGNPNPNPTPPVSTGNNTNGSGSGSGTSLANTGDLAKTGDHVGASVMPLALLAVASSGVVVLSVVRRKKSSEE